MGSILVERFREEVSKCKDHRIKDEMEKDVGYPTGFLVFDFLNGLIVHVKSEHVNFKYNSLGIVDGSIAMFIGRSGSGKTTFAIQSAFEIIRPFETGSVYYDSIEGGVVLSRLETLSKLYGKDLTSRSIIRDRGINCENVYERIKMIHDIKTSDSDRGNYEYDTGLLNEEGEMIIKLEPTVYILDSLSLLMPAQLTEEEKMSGQMSTTASAKTNAQLFRRVIPLLKSANIILFVINHITEKVDISPFARKKNQLSFLKQDENLPGGRTPVYLANLLVRIDDGAKLKESEGYGIQGSIVELTLIKSRTSAAGNSVNLIFDYNHGFDNELSLFQLLKEEGYVNGAGSHFYLGDHKEIKFAQKDFKTKLAESEELQKIFVEVSKEALSKLIGNPIDEQHNKSEEFNLSSAIISQMAA